MVVEKVYIPSEGSARGNKGWADILVPTETACTLTALECAEWRKDADLRRKVKEDYITKTNYYVIKKKIKITSRIM